VESAYRPGNPTDFDRLYRDTYGRLLGTLVVLLGDRAAAEDCLQDAFVQAFKAWPRWNPSAPAEAWLHRIAVNRAISYKRWSKLREVGEIVRRLGRPGEIGDPAELPRAALVKALGRLPAKQAAAMVLRYYHGYTNREIAVGLGVPERTIASRLSTAKGRLRVELGDFRPEQTGSEPAGRVPAQRRVMESRDV